MADFLSASDKARIAEAVRQAEKTTSGEIVTVIARRSGLYRTQPLLWAILLALATPLVLWPTGWNFATLYELQLAAFAVFGLAFQWPPIKRLLVSRDDMRTQASRRAREQFFAQNLHRTQDATGVLLFVSLFERHVEVLGDAGIDAKLPEGAWTKVVEDFVAEVKAGRVAEGFLAAIADCSTLLTEHFPARRDNVDELPNPLVEID